MTACVLAHATLLDSEDERRRHNEACSHTYGRTDVRDAQAVGVSDCSLHSFPGSHAILARPRPLLPNSGSPVCLDLVVVVPACCIFFFLLLLLLSCSATRCTGSRWSTSRPIYASASGFFGAVAAVPAVQADQRGAAVHAHGSSSHSSLPHAWTGAHGQQWARGRSVGRRAVGEVSRREGQGTALSWAGPMPHGRTERTLHASLHEHVDP